MGIIEQEDKKNISLPKDLVKLARKKKLSVGLEYFLKAETLRNSELFNESVRFYLSSLLIESKNFDCYMGLVLMNCIMSWEFYIYSAKILTLP